MSKFRTVIPVAVATILAKLPKGSYVHEIKMTPEKDGVEVIWDNDLIIAKFQQIDFPPECFDGEFPADVVRVIGAESKVQSPKSNAGESEPAQAPEKTLDTGHETLDQPGVGNKPVAPEAEKPKRKRG